MLAWLRDHGATPDLDVVVEGETPANDHAAAVNKIAPFEKGLKDYKAWITGIRHNQASTRKSAHFVENYRDRMVKNMARRAKALGYTLVKAPEGNPA
jgi:3'-phosphoadenosine 5'-phosphosulfate sulfotransferase (PAPS reductase)/FAD synthetase